MRDALVCTSPIESQFYSAVLVHFPHVCYHCGLGEESLVDNEEVRELKHMYAVVHPICFVCLSDGRKPFCRKPNVAKKQRTSYILSET